MELHHLDGHDRSTALSTQGATLRRVSSKQYKGDGESGLVDERTDADLAVAARTDTAAFEELYSRHVGSVVRFASRRARTPERAVQLVLKTMKQNGERHGVVSAVASPKSAPKPWFMRV